MGEAVRLWSRFVVIGIGAAIVCVAAGLTAKGATGKPDVIKVCLVRTATTLAECRGRPEVDLNVGFRPRRLSHIHKVPISLFLATRLSMPDGGSPPGLTELRIDIDRHVGVETRDVPACGRREIATATVARARRACEDAIVGTGRLWVERPSSESNSPRKLRPPLIVFNGGARSGVTTLLLYSPAGQESTEPLVTAVKIKRRRKGVYGWEALIRLSRLAGAEESVTGIQLYLRRTAKPVMGHVFVAACSADRLTLRVNYVLADDTVLAGTVVRPCSSSRRKTFDAR